MTQRARWESLADARALGDELAASEHQFLAELDEPEVARERWIYDELAAMGRPQPVESADRRRAAATLAAFRQAQSSPARRDRPQGQSRGLSWAAGIGAAALAVAAAVTLWIAWPTTGSVLMQDDARISSGTLMLDGVALGPGDSLPVDRWVVARAHLCVQLASGQGCVSPSSRLRVHDGRFELESGTIRLSGAEAVVSEHGTFDVSDGEAELQIVDGEPRLEVEQGSVSVLRNDGQSEHVVPGQIWTGPGSAGLDVLEPATDELSDVWVEPARKPSSGRASGSSGRPGRARAAPSASELLGVARGHVAAGDIGRALSVYSTLRRQHAGSPEARAANVSIGKLELRQGRPKAALRAFSRYLSGGGGALEEEAHWGKIRALHRLRRSQQRDAAIADLRRVHPSSVYLRRADEL